ncbi:MAG: hypothetical protein AVDCRST_MAG67-2896 [uncultured Solirubrobacteraceae bacterium]|uniref:Uncharacterized protein n=1 Tax=uncultured Solirubrobacteraceae bacterium TaxID=1162706 RepID=A0A6J4T494_9ACTN|nr:MAG: hypothetical protein AVDCRST_MAG67-2896 [uncultured Solirubrobacteraceae bacterium]
MARGHRGVGDSAGATSLRQRDDGDSVRDERELDERIDRRRTTARATRRERQHEEFGGISWLSTLVGWLAAAGLTAILAGILGAAGAALALNEVGNDVSGAEAETIGLASGIALLLVLAIAYFFGGYAAGRMARFDGARQGVGVWLWGIIAAVIVAVLAAIGGSKYNVLDALNLPRLPVDSGTLTSGGVIALVASIVVTLGAAVLGGKTGERFHRKVDRVGDEA